MPATDDDKLVKAMEKEIIRQSADEIQKSMASMRCKKHGQPPKITLVGATLENTEAEISACCEAFEREVAKHLEAIWRRL